MRPASKRPADTPDTGARVLVVGAGFAGVECAARLLQVGDSGAPVPRVTVVSPNDYQLYTPLLPAVAGGLIDPRHVAVPLSHRLSGAQLVNGLVSEVDLDTRQAILADRTRLDWDYLVVSAGSVSQLHDVPGVAEHAFGLKSLAQALYLRDHLVGTLEDSERESDPARREQMRTVVVVGASYAGTELVAELRALATRVARQRGFDPASVRFVLLDVAERVMPEIGESLADRAVEALSERGIEVRLGTTIEEMGADRAELTDGTSIDTSTVAWVAGVRSNPFVERLGLPLRAGMLAVDAHLRSEGNPRVYGGGDAAAVPDLANEDRDLTPPTAQHAVRQGRTIARNVAADLGIGSPATYRHRDLGLVVDLGPDAAVANPFGFEVAGLAAKVVARGEHLRELRDWGNRIGVMADWLASGALARPVVHLGLVRPSEASFDSEHR